MDIPHSSVVVTGRRVPLWKRPDWDDHEVLAWIAASPVLILGALGWFAWIVKHPSDAGWISILVALLAIAIGAGVLYTRFIADRRVEGPCAACGKHQRWSAGQEECRECPAWMQVAVDGTIREVGLDETGRFQIIVDRETLGDAVDEKGHVAFVMPAICAVCGAPPTTTGKVKNTTDLKNDDEVTTTTANDLAALAVPLCAQHASDTPVAVDAYLAWLEITSYRYYRALLIANPAKKEEPARQVAPAPDRPRAMPGTLEPLICDDCGAPVAVGDGDVTTCAACGHTAPLPEPYKLLRDAKKMSDQDAAELQALAADIAKPPPAWKRVAMIVGYIVGGATVVVMAIGAIVGGILGAIAGSPLGDAGAKLLAILGAVLLGIVSIPYVGEIVASMAVLHDSGASADIINSASPAFRYDLIAAGILYGLGVIPIALAYRTQGNLKQIVELQGKLAAQRSPSAGGALCCRHCGAALDIARDAVVARCLFCGTDNLLTVPVAAASSHHDEAKQLDTSVQDALAQHERERAGDRAMTGGLLILGLLLVPYVCLAGYLFHRVFCS